MVSELTKLVSKELEVGIAELPTMKGPTVLSELCRVSPSRALQPFGRVRSSKVRDEPYSPAKETQKKPGEDVLSGFD